MFEVFLQGLRPPLLYLLESNHMLNPGLITKLLQLDQIETCPSVFSASLLNYSLRANYFGR
jgi:hypothetical protein